MDNFFKQFQDNLENRPQPPFEEKDWLALEKQLPPQHRKRPLSTLLFWTLAPLLLLSLGANWFFYHKMKNTEQQMALFNNGIETVKSKTIVLQTDTIYKFQTIIERDTIYKTRILRETVVTYLPYTPDNFQKNNTVNTPLNSINNTVNTPLNSIDTTENIVNEQLKNNAFSVNLKDHSNDNSLIFKELEKLNTIPMSPLKLKKQDKLLALGNFPIIKNEHKTLGQRLEVLRPKDYSLGVSAGLSFPFGDGLSQSSGYSVGLNGAMFFSPNISIWADAQYLQLSYKVDKMSDAIGVPIVPPPSSLFNFNRAIIKQPTIQYIVGLRYRFDSPKRWQPYLGVGFGAVTSLPYEVGYEFKNNSLGTVWDVDLKVQKKGTQWGFLLFDAGFEKRLSKQYRWKIGADYRVNLSANGLQSQRILGIKSGISFDF